MGHGMKLPHLQKARWGKVWQVWQGHGRNAATPPHTPFRGWGSGALHVAREVGLTGVWHCGGQEAAHV